MVAAVHNRAIKKRLSAEALPMKWTKKGLKKVATVSKSGKIKAKGKGKCTIVAFAHNGVSKRTKVTVK